MSKINYTNAEQTFDTLFVKAGDKNDKLES